MTENLIKTSIKTLLSQLMTLQKRFSNPLKVLPTDTPRGFHVETTCRANYHDINCLIYATAVTCKAYIQDIQQNLENQKESNTLPKWLHHLEQSISMVRKELNYINPLIKCKKENSNSKHQKMLLNKYRKNIIIPPSDYLNTKAQF